MTIEEALTAAFKGGITHLSVTPSGKQWTCQATPSTVHKYVSVTHDDPTVAMIECLKALPKAPLRTRKEVTAAVNEPRPEEDKLHEPTTEESWMLKD